MNNSSNFFRKLENELFAIANLLYKKMKAHV
jgi:hypothetical protein